MRIGINQRIAKGTDMHAGAKRFALGMYHLREMALHDSLLAFYFDILLCKMVLIQ